MNKTFTRDEIAKALMECNIECSDKCPLRYIAECIEVRNDLASKYILNTNIGTQPLKLNDLIEADKVKTPVFILGYGWYFITQINIMKNKITIYTEDDKNFIYTEEESRFYGHKVEEEYDYN